MSFAIPTIDEVLVAGALVNVPVTPAQARAVVESIERFEAPDSPCLGLKSWHIPSPGQAIPPPRRAGDEAFVEVHFHYLPENVELTPLGLEVTLFNPAGTVLSPQDFASPPGAEPGAVVAALPQAAGPPAAQFVAERPLPQTGVPVQPPTR